MWHLHLRVEVPRWTERKEPEMAQRWNVWSKGGNDQRWMVVVDSVTEKEAREAQERKRVAAARFSVEAEYVALPVGETP